MKKTSLIIVALLLVAIAILPVVGNKYMQSSVEEALKNADAHGLKLLTSKTDESYLNTKKHFEFVIEDSSEFVAYINSHAHTQMPAQTQSELDGTVIGFDVSYSNIPFAKSVHFALYPLKLSKVVSDELKTEDIGFYNHLAEFLKNKGLFYYGEYNLINSEFKSYLKDIDDHYTLQNSSDVNITVKGASFNGEGDILVPEKLVTRVKTIHFMAAQKEAYAKLFLENFQTNNHFVSWSDYTNEAAFDSMEFAVVGTGDDISIDIEAFKTSSNAVKKAKHVEMYSKSSVKNIKLVSKQLNLVATNLKTDVSVTDVALEPFERLSAFMTDTSSTNMMMQQQVLQEDILAILAEGMQIKINDISLENLTLNDTKKFGGFKLNLDFKVKKDADVAKKMKQSPLLFLSNIEMDSKMTLSKPFYSLLLQSSPMAQQLNAYAKEDHGNVVFDVTLHNAKLQVNGKTLK